MSKLIDQASLREDPYNNASNQDARTQLHRRFSINKIRWTNWIFDRLQLPARSRILDLSCGPGDLWRDNLQRIPGGWYVTLCDFSPGMLRQAQDNLRAYRYFAFEVIDAETIPCENESFDAVIANSVLYHVADRPKLLSEIYRVLKPGGRLYATTYGRNHLREIRELIGAIDPDADLMNAASEFGLENGFDQLSQFFPSVKLHRYQDALIVTEVEPLVAYILSTKRSALLNERPNALAYLIQHKLKVEGAVFVTKDGGMFEAIKQDV